MLLFKININITTDGPLFGFLFHGYQNPTLLPKVDPKSHFWDDFWRFLSQNNVLELKDAMAPVLTLPLKYEDCRGFIDKQ